MKNKSKYFIGFILTGIALIVYRVVTVLLGKKAQNELPVNASQSDSTETNDLALGGYNQTYLDLISPFSLMSNFNVNEAKRTTRGFRNNNPGNLVYVPKRNWQGRKMPRTDTKFDQFVGLDFGVSAMIRVLEENITAGKTLKELIYKYAPPGENNTQSYLNSAMKKVGLKSVDSRMDTTHLKSLTITLIQLENSTTISDAEYDLAFKKYLEYYAA